MLNTDKNLKQYFSIGEVAERFGVTESLLRFWEKEFPSVIKPMKGGRGVRMYTEKDIEKIGLIYHLVKERGMTLEGARRKITKDKGTEQSEKQLKIINYLKAVRDELQAIGKELNDLN